MGNEDVCPLTALNCQLLWLSSQMPPEQGQGQESILVPSVMREQSELNSVHLHDLEKPPVGDGHLPQMVVSSPWKISPLL